MIISNQHPRTKAHRYMSVPLTQRQYQEFIRGRHVDGVRLTKDQVSFMRTGLLLMED